MSDLRRSLEELLRERREATVDRERTAFDRQAGSLGRSLVLFGAGHLGRKTLSGLRKAGFEPVAFADNDTGLWGKEVSGVPVLSLPDAARRHAEAIVVVTIWLRPPLKTKTKLSVTVEEPPVPSPHTCVWALSM